MKSSSWLAFLLVLPALIAAQAPIPIEDAVRIAMRENQDINIARLSDAQVDAQTNWGTAGLLPTVSATGSTVFSVNDVTQELANATAGPTEINDAGSQVLNADLSLNYVLFDGFGRINNLNKLRFQKDLSETQLRFSIENTLLQLFNTYYNASLQWHQLKVEKEAIALSLRRYQRSTAAFKLGGGSRLDMLNAEVDLNTDSVNYLNALRNYDQGLRDLNLLLNFPIDSLLQVDTLIPINSTLNYGKLQSSAFENNAALVQAEFNREISRKDISIARSDLSPEISGNAGYAISRVENDGSFLIFNQQQGWQAGISVRWNLFNGYRTATEIESAKIRLEQSEVARSQAHNQLNLDLAKAWIDYQTNLKILKTEERNISTARLNFQRSQQAYDLGQINSSQLREAQLNYIRAKLVINNLQFSVKVSEIELQRIAGTLIQTQAE